MSISALGRNTNFSGYRVNCGRLLLQMVVIIAPLQYDFASLPIKREDWNLTALLSPTESDGSEVIQPPNLNLKPLRTSAFLFLAEIP